ncbi:hypothetical protein BFC18_20935 [Alteromonas confluentis]|uniref:Uncharacterized protein n=1 Tax=Alteromonas confluentis TaxID=1656094 RepID=A0A1E7Z6M8_9ALTE|nr:hypothetical protein BFC18_20935 [Alteromonas confluentis]
MVFCKEYSIPKPKNRCVRQAVISVRLSIYRLSAHFVELTSSSGKYLPVNAKTGLTKPGEQPDNNNKEVFCGNIISVN